MKHLVEYELETGGTVLVEVEDSTGDEAMRVGRAGDIAAKATQTFESAVEQIKPAAVAIINKLREISVPVDEIGVEFGVKFGAKAGTFLASADTEANFKVSLKWQRKEDKSLNPGGAVNPS